MLKLTNSFYRYLWLSCENISPRAKVRNSKHLSCRRKSFFLSFHDSTPLVTLPMQSGQLLRPYSVTNKRARSKKQGHKSNASKNDKQMSESLHPTLSHASYRGHFQSTADARTNPSSQWRKEPSEELHNSNNPKISQSLRRWETICDKSTSHDGFLCKFRLMSYNVLAQYLLECHPYLYTECSPHNLKWKVRGSRLYEEILEFSPDILCLQEVEASHLNTFYRKFEEIGYSAVYKRKTGDRHDGCAIYFKEARFTLLDATGVEYYQPELPLLNRDNIGVIVKLAPKDCPEAAFVVATTHLLYNPKRTDVRLAQIQVFLAEIDRFAYYNNNRESGHYPIILTGDLNSTPDNAVVKLLDTGKVSAESFRDMSDWKKIGVTDKCQHLSVQLSRQSGEKESSTDTLKLYNSERDSAWKQREAEAEVDSVEERYPELFNSGTLSHELNLASVYERVKQTGDYEATTYQDQWVTVDYIYFSRYSMLSLVERLRLPTAKECEILGRLPSALCPSDHLPLAATFELRLGKCSL